MDLWIDYNHASASLGWMLSQGFFLSHGHSSAFHLAIVAFQPFSTLLFDRLYLLWAFWWWCKRVAEGLCFKVSSLFLEMKGKNRQWLIKSTMTYCFQEKFYKLVKKFTIVTFLSALFLDSDISLSLFLYFLQKFIVNCFDNVM